VLEQLGILGNIAVLIIALVVLLKASNLAINNSVNLASATGLGKTKIGFLLVAFSTSLPELFVALFAIGAPQTIGISVGNVLGSNIANVCLILGIGFIIMAIKYPESSGFFTKMASDEVGSLNFGVLVSSLVPLILLFIGYSSQIVGVFLIALFVYNTYELTKKKGTVEEISIEAEKRNLGKYAVKSSLGIIGVVASAYFIVESASFLASSAGVPPVIIGGTIVAFGTSVPELATSIAAVRKGFIDLALGNVIGSNFLNITLILGVTFLLSPFNVNLSGFFSLVFFSLLSTILLSYILQNAKVRKREGVILLAIYSIFLATSIASS
jgi:cation:H+ antiporter